VKPISLLLLFFLSLYSLPAQVLSQSVHTYVDSDSLQVGDIFEVTYVVEGVYNSLSYPDEDTFEEDIELLSRQRFQSSAGRDSLVYRFQFFGTDNLTITPKEITLHRSDSDTVVTTGRVPLFFKTVLAEGDDEFRPFKPIFEFARSVWPFILMFILLVAAAYYIYRWYSKREIKPEPKPAVPPPPFENPLERLNLQLSELPDTASLEEMEDYERYYIRLGDAIRLYLKSVYEIPALEMTTREITAGLQVEHAAPGIIKITRTVLNEADMVKFANFRPTRDLADNVLRKAREFAETAKVTDYEKIEYLKFRYEKSITDAEEMNPAPSEIERT
jgi:hypothetical protein